MTNFTICETPDILRIIYFIKILINIVKTIVPIALILLVIFSCVKGVINDTVKFGDSLKTNINKIVSAILIFAVPSIINIVLEVIDANTDYESCWVNANSTDIKYFQAMWDEKEEQEEQEEQEKEEQEGQEEQEKEEQEGQEEQEEETKNENSDGDVSNISPSYKPIQKTDNLTVNYYKNFTYWLYLPDKVTKNLPIIVYLPGLGERGNDYYNGTQTGVLYGPINEIKDYGYSYNAIIIHLQVPSDGSVYGYLSSYITLINEIADEFSANKNKISIIGFSHGCYGLVDMISKYPNYFSAAVFVGCAPNKKNDLSKFTNQAIWAFVGGGDGNSDYKDDYGEHYSLENFVNNINLLNGNAKYTSVKEKANVHNIMNDNYSILRDSDYNVIEWMMKQSLGKKASK